MNYITAPHRKTLQAKLCTFMNQCEGGSCGCTGDDAKKPDEFERAAIDAMEAIDVVALAPYQWGWTAIADAKRAGVHPSKTS